MQVRVGDPETILIYIARRFNYEVRSLSKGDIAGFRPMGQLPQGSSTNMASGTAIQILPDTLPIGTKGGFFESELKIIRSILEDCEGVVAWGGDSTRTDEALFEIVRGPHDKSISAVASKIREWNETPNQGAGNIKTGA